MTITEANSGRRATDAAIQQQLAPSRLGQATAVEQSRAVAEVQAAIVVAQQCPRNPAQAGRAVWEACGQMALAERAFFRYPKGKDENGKPVYVNGPSVHLARELARCWGNIQYGISELRRDDGFGQSEMLAFAWDVQTNARASTTFIVPHRRDTKTGVKQLTDLRDVYENNANNGARRVREMIFAVMPVWLIEDAIEACHTTLKKGGGRPLAQRIADALRMFGELGVTEAQLESKLGQPSRDWTDQDAAQLSVIYRSIKRGEARKEDEFPAAAARVTAEEITGPKVTGPKPATEAARKRMNDLIGQIGLGPPEDIAALVQWITGTDGSQPLTIGQADNVTTLLADALEAAGGDTDKAAAEIWAQYKRMNPQAGDDGA